jgi:hypothetical protein
MSPPSPTLDSPADLERDLAALREVAPPGEDVAAPSEAELARLRRGVDELVDDERGLLAGLRSLRRWQSAVLLGMAVALEIGVVITLVPRADLRAYPLALMILALLVLAALGGASVWRLLRPLHLPAASRGRTAVLVAVSLLGAFAIAALPMEHLGAPAGEGQGFWIACGKCLAFGGALGLPVGLVAIAAQRSATGGAMMVALAGIFAGLAGNLCLQVHCPITDPAHLLWGHAPLLLVFGAIAAAMSGRLRRLR